MASNAMYDERLLASAPVATKSELQEGYNIDILKPKPRPPPSRAPVAVPTASEQDHLQPELIPSVEKLQPQDTRVPFWRTTKGRIIIAAAVLIVIIAVAVGAGVGAAKHSNSHANSTHSSAPASASSTLAVGGNNPNANPESTSTSKIDTAKPSSALTTSPATAFQPPASSPASAPGTIAPTIAPLPITDG